MRKVLLLLAAVWSICAEAAERFPRPDFESGYVRPLTQVPAPRADYWQAVDLGLLILGLLAAVWLAHRRRSRSGLLLLAACSVAYFGFWRAGCVCPVGSVQNVALGAGGWGGAIPAVVLLFFLLPPVLTLLFGRVFCAGVCPLGAAQEVMLVRPLAVPQVLDRILRIGPWLFLGLAVLYAFTNTAFLICEHDPFVPFFRLSGSMEALLAGGAILLLSTVIGRPYCRYVCPYGALLSACARLAWKPVRITPQPCVRCRACATACPYGAIRPPEQPATPGGRGLVVAALLLPGLIFFGAWSGYRLSGVVAERNPVVARAQVMRLAQNDLTPQQREVADAFLQTHTSVEDLQTRARQVQERINIAATVTGGMLGLIAGLGLLGLARRRSRLVYEAAAEHCFACGRCFESCPRNRIASRGTKKDAACSDGAESDPERLENDPPLTPQERSAQEGEGSGTRQTAADRKGLQ